MPFIHRPVTTEVPAAELPALGKLAKREDPLTLKASKYIDEGAALAALEKLAPLDVRGKVSVPMYKNDDWGICGPAGLAHAINAWRAWQAIKAGKPVPKPLTQAQVTAFYVAVTTEMGKPFNPKTGANDTGVVLLDMLKVAASEGIGGHVIGAYVDVDIDPSSPLYDWASCAFGGLILGYRLPTIVQDMRPWTFTPPAKPTGIYLPGGWGGHCVYESANDQKGNREVETWGGEKAVSKPYDDTYRDEAWGILSQDQMDGDVDAISGLSLGDLKSDLQKAKAK